MKRLTKSQYEAIAETLGKALNRIDASEAFTVEIESELVALFSKTDNQFKPTDFYVSLMNGYNRKFKRD